MPWPTQTTIGTPARAPYNFVPLAETVYEPKSELPPLDRFMRDRHSGFVTVTVTTETWLYVRAAVSPAAAEKAERMESPAAAVWEPGAPQRAFFHHGDKEQRPVIPGSSFRGMLRHLVRSMAAGSLDTPTGTLMYRAVGDSASGLGKHYAKKFVGPTATGQRGYPLPTVKGGYLFRKGRTWYIQPAREPLNESFVRVDEQKGTWFASLGAAGMANPSARQHLPGLPVWVKPASRAAHGPLSYALSEAEPAVRDGTPPPAGFEAGVLIVTDRIEPDKKRYHCVIYEPALEEEPLAITPECQDQYLQDARVRREGGRTGRILATSPEDPPELTAGATPFSGYPCFYLKADNGDVEFFGGTLFFRLPYKRPGYRFAWGSRRDDLCKRVFGTVERWEEHHGRTRVETNRIRKGRIRVEDLVWMENGVQPSLGGDDPSPHPLLQPKPTSVQHYLVQPDAAPASLLHYDTKPFGGDAADEGTVARGFKHYWHRRGDAVPEEVARESVGPWTNVTVDKQSSRTVIRPVGRGVQFSGRLYFDNLDPVELGALLSALELPPMMRHKLGMARPLGFGSVKVALGPLRLIDPTSRYQNIFCPKSDPSDPDSGALWGGWRPDGEEVKRRALEAFAKEMARHEGAPAPEGVSHEQIVAHFWQLPRMRDLAALLTWEPGPEDDLVKPVDVDDLQWKARRVLPPPTQVVHR